MFVDVREKLHQFWDTRMHFLELHYTYIALIIFVSSAFYYFEPGTSWAYIDVLFTTTTACTNTGLNVVPMSSMGTYKSLLMFFNSFIGSHIFISIVVVHVRKYYFSKRFEDTLIFNKARRLREEHRRQMALDRQKKHQNENDDTPISIESPQAIYPTQTDTVSQLSEPRHPYDPTPQLSADSHNCSEHSPSPTMPEDDTQHSDHLRRVTSVEDATEITEPQTVSGPQGIAFADNIIRQRENARMRLEKTRRIEQVLKKMADETYTVHDSNSETDNQDADHYDDIMRQPIDKSQLTREQRYTLGGVEYRALDMLSKLVPIYYIGIIAFFAFLYRIEAAASSYTTAVLQTSNTNGPVNPWFYSFFLSISAFNNLGLSLLDDSMSPFRNSPAPLIFAIILILVGNTAYAIILRFIIWCLYKLTPESRSLRRETFRFLLEHPRRCYTTLFPATQTWWLLIILVGITLIEVVAFLSLNYWLPVLEGIEWGSRILDGVFQSVATRNAGFSVLSLADINPGTQLVYIVAMYISVYPVAISMRNSNIYQERALGIYRGDNDEEKVEFSDQDLNGPAPFIKLRRHPTISSVMTASRKVLRGPDFFVITQIQRQLTSDICWVICGVFTICVIESQAIMSPSPITIATVIYECVSAFGNVGASTGYPGTTTSQAGQYRTLSKLVLIALMYRGRHRGLPASIDRAVLLPSEQLEEFEQNDMEDKITRRRNTSTSQSNGPSLLVYNRSSTL
ncbi:hypothetical protein PHYBLDRAFT_116311 [Phycomyces blakesleeanus NRRL 1555(-)]|uniref:Potassium transport protein n=1 Tax=Phycomyces blakesleeanus (strain ATCC 8743b / DSM 1359 / FGSC 10004 / NBRC 33097 / NRRL 1555) TaxID=763407 RepID=A0A167L3F4_PHYB8|nr:hypothetical protein PHYBLDRAFT_116311 [Phycomyces blakesleeanus NRRL 1555(-)]OAD69506.1 hypothetical protein PHYBLDRAFT_116311 [Phycomyces blakesleeanus NRRL 1555(-)]|eukprot:XP_018287546.1 hypothetical protein PHYBLDRAFT_116311 [Phycomyces blakesleeanus NRRL 1555(-)]